MIEKYREQLRRVSCFVSDLHEKGFLFKPITDILFPTHIHPMLSVWKKYIKLKNNLASIEVVDGLVPHGIRTSAAIRYIHSYIIVASY